MGPAKKSWQAATDSALEEPPTKVQAIEIPEEESDNEYEVVPKKAKKVEVAALPVTQQVAPAVQAPAVLPPVDAMVVDTPEPSNEPADDDDWLRSRTNRLLDVMDPDEMSAMPKPTLTTDVQAVAQQVPQQAAAEDLTLSGITINETTIVEEPANDTKVLAEDPNIEAIKSNGRLFVRNLPYSATEEDLREHFSKYGSLDEVRENFSFISWHSPTLLYMMNIQIGTTYTFVNAVNCTIILVDASCFLIKSFVDYIVITYCFCKAYF